MSEKQEKQHEKNVDTTYLFKCLSANMFFDFAMQYAKGEKMPRGDKKEILKYPISLPPLSLQQSFASKIEAIERQKELIKQSIAETETLFNSRMDYYFN
jgi:type I restriction enzyme S subunit